MDRQAKDKEAREKQGKELRLEAEKAIQGQGKHQSRPALRPTATETKSPNPTIKITSTKTLWPR